MTSTPPAQGTTTKHPASNGSGAKPKPRRSAAPLVRFRLDAEMARLKAQGVVIAFDVMDTPGCRLALVCDPDGNKIMIHKRKVQ